MNAPIKDIPRKKLNYLLYGTDDLLEFNYVSKNGNTRNTTNTYEGVIPALERRYMETKSNWIREWLDNYIVEMPCPTCGGKRLQESVLSIYINKKNIFDLTDMSIKDLYEFMCNLKLDEEEAKVSELILKEIKSRLEFLNNVGLSYLTLTRSAGTLSGGEAQRIKLATYLTRGITKEKVLFIFDEPTTGLHFHDIKKLLKSFNALIENGHSVIVIEHNLDLVKCADYIIDIGPEGGEYGGELVAFGTPEEIVKNKKSETAKYLKDKL